MIESDYCKILAIRGAPPRWADGYAARRRWNTPRVVGERGDSMLKWRQIAW